MVNRDQQQFEWDPKKIESISQNIVSAFPRQQKSLMVPG